MTLPELPTDNLYKFMALAGLVGIFYAPSFYLIEATNVMTATVEATTELRVAVEDARALSEDMGDLKRELRQADIRRALLRKARARAARLHSTPEALERAKEIVRELEQDEKRRTEVALGLEQRSRELNKLHARVLGKTELTNLLQSRLKVLSGLVKLTTIVSAIFAVCGLWWWYWFIQRPLNAAMVKEAGAGRGKRG